MFKVSNLYVCCIIFFQVTFSQRDTVEYSTSYVGFQKDWSRPEGSRDEATIDGPQSSFFDELTDTVYFIDEFSNRVSKFSALSGHVSKVAGSGVYGHSDGPFSTAQFRHNYGLARDTSGNYYVSDLDSHTIRKLFVSNSTVITFAGIPGVSGDLDGPVGIATFNTPRSLTFDSDGNLYVADAGNHKIRRITPAGNVETVAGNGGQGFVDGPALEAVFNYPMGIAIHPTSQDIFVTDRYNHVIRKISNGLVSTFAGSYVGYSDGFTTRARFSHPEGISIDAMGNLYVSDSGNLVVRKIDLAGYVSTIAGRPGAGGTENGLGLKSSVRSMRGIHVSANGTVFFADWDSGRIRIAFPTSEKNPHGKYFWQRDDFDCYTGYCVQTVFGSGVPSDKSGNPTFMSMYSPTGIFYQEQSGNVYITTFNGKGIFVANVNESFVYRLAGRDDAYSDGYLFDARFRCPSSIVADNNGSLYLTDYYAHTIRKIDLKTGLVSTFAGSIGATGSSDGQGSAASFNKPGDIAMDNYGNIYVADQDNNKIRKINSSGYVETFAGTGNGGFSDSSYLSSQFNRPSFIAVDVTGTIIYVSDLDNHKIRKLTGGFVSTWAGGGQGFSDGPGTSAAFNRPYGIDIDTFGRLYVSDTGNRRIRMINSTAYVTTIAGRGSFGYQDGPGSKAEFLEANALSVKSDGSVIYLSDYYGHRIRIICLSKCQNNGTMDCVTGLCNCPLGWTGENCTIKSTATSTSSLTTATSTSMPTASNIDISEWTVSYIGSAYGDDNGPRNVAKFRGPWGIAYNENTKTIFVSDCRGHYIKKITEDGQVSLYAGAGSGNTDGAIAGAQFNCPLGITLDGNGDMYVCNFLSHTIRKISNGIVYTLAGTAGSAGSADGQGANARFYNPRDIIFDKNGLLIVTGDDHRIRQINPVNAQVTTIMGKGYRGHVDGSNSEALSNSPHSTAIDSKNNIYFTDYNNHVIRKISSDRSTVSTFAGSDNGDALGVGTKAMFSYPTGITVDANDNLYVNDYGNRKIKRIDTNGVVTLMSGTGGYGTRNGKALESSFRSLRTIRSTPNGTIIIADEDGYRVRLLFPTKMKGLAPFNFVDDWECQFGTWCVQRFAGNEADGANNGPNLYASLFGPEGLAIDEKNNRIFVSEDYTNILRVIRNGFVQTYAGNGGRGLVDGRYTSIGFGRLIAIALDPTSTILYGLEYDSHVIRRIFLNNGTIGTLAGSAYNSGSQDGQGSNARFHSPWGITTDKDGNIYVAATHEHKIRFVTASGLVSTITGTGSAGFRNGNLTEAQFNYPRGVAVDANYTIFVCDLNNHIVRKIEAGSVSTLAGKVGVAGWQDGIGTSAIFYEPFGITVDKNGDLYVIEHGGRKLRRIGKNANVTTIAGTGNSGTQTGLGIKAEFVGPRGNPVVNSNGTVFVPDWAGRFINTVCLSTCVNGVMIDCVSLTCRCDTGWTGSTCNISIITTTTTSTTSTTTSSTTSTTTFSTTSITTSSTTSTTTSLTTSTTFSDITASSTTASTFSSISDSGSKAHTSKDEYFVSTSTSLFERSESPFGTQNVSVIAIAASGGILLLSLAFVACGYYQRRRFKKKQSIPFRKGEYLQSPSKMNYNLSAVSMISRSNINTMSRNFLNNNSFIESNSIGQGSLDASAVTRSTTSGYNRLIFEIDFYLPEGVERIGAGGNASLYTGKLLNQALIASNDGKIDVAVKMGKMTDASSVQAFHYEVGIMANLQGNANIAKLIGYTETPYYCFVMKKYSCSLQSLIDDTEFEKSIANAAFIGYEVSNGLKYIHSKGLIHLDIKPLNILIEAHPQGNYNCVICDFGSASVVGDTPKVRGFVAPERMEFTCRYTPPEVFRRMMMKETTRPASDNDKSIDVYAFSITIFEVIAREKGYKGMKPDEIVKSVLVGVRPVWPEVIRSDVTYANLLEVVKSCWADSPSARPNFDQIHEIFKSLVVS